jgi:HAD superfamily hydrolase (TIGR01509 family)
MRGVIFDFDGTIADTSYIWKEVDRLFFAKRGMDVPKDYVDAISTMSFVQGAVYTKDKYQLEESIEDIMAEWNNSALYEYQYKAELKPYVKEYIVNLRKNGIRLGLATASHPEYYMPVLKRGGILEYFDGFAHGQDDVAGKDKLDIYLLCAERMGVEPKDCRVYEDVLKGILSAKLAGMETVAVYDNQPKAVWEQLKAEADSYITSYCDVIKQN